MFPILITYRYSEMGKHLPYQQIGSCWKSVIMRLSDEMKIEGGGERAAKSWTTLKVWQYMSEIIANKPPALEGNYKSIFVKA